MDTAALVRCMPGLSYADAQTYIAEVNDAMHTGGITTVNRVAGFLGVYIGEESQSMRYREEIAKNGRYAPYIGRTFGQLTWDYNYRAFGQWMHQHRPDLLADPNLFVRNPSELAARRWAVWGALWYWLAHDLNSLADRGDVPGLTRAINGGMNGYDDRLYRWNLIRGIGTAVLPSGSPQHTPKEQDMIRLRAQVSALQAWQKLAMARNKIRDQRLSRLERAVFHGGKR